MVRRAPAPRRGPRIEAGRLIAAPPPPDKETEPRSWRRCGERAQCFSAGNSQRRLKQAKRLFALVGIGPNFASAFRSPRRQNRGGQSAKHRFQSRIVNTGYRGIDGGAIGQRNWWRCRSWGQRNRAMDEAEARDGWPAKEAVDPFTNQRLLVLQFEGKGSRSNPDDQDTSGAAGLITARNDQSFRPASARQVVPSDDRPLRAQPGCRKTGLTRQPRGQGRH